VSSVDLLINKFIRSQGDSSRPNSYEAPPTNTLTGNINNISVGNVAGSNVNELTPPAKIQADMVSLHLQRYRLTWYPFKDPTFGFDQL